jgi:hypothetical protein
VRKVRRRFALYAGLSFVALIAVAEAVAQLHDSAISQESAARVEGADNQRIAFAAACVKLAEAELAEAEDLNRRVAKAVSEFEILRLKKCVALAENNYSYAQQGVDYSQSIAEYVQARSELAELDLKMAEELKANHPEDISEAELEKLRRYADVCRLRAAISNEPASTNSVIDHLHWETHRLSEEVLQLNRRLERLEKKTTLR